MAMTALTSTAWSQTLSSDTTVQPTTMKLIFIGDIMGHGPQIRSAYQPATDSYDYKPVFLQVAPIIKSADYAIANLEVTLAGPPFKGYPQFSSPDALAADCKYNGIDVMVTANNHSCDRGGDGLVRTIDVLDSLDIMHTGTFRNAEARAQQNLLQLTKDDITVGMLNYTYGTNGLPAPPPTLVNLIDTAQMRLDIESIQPGQLDQLIVFIHWGSEYQSHPHEQQIAIADFLFDLGVDIIIGSHPHVLQRMERITHPNGDRFIAYSLGNFVSNQRKPKTDGGAMVELTLEKKDGQTRVSDCGYHLTWVNKSTMNDRTTYEILPARVIERLQERNVHLLDSAATYQMGQFTEASRELLNQENRDVPEVGQTRVR